jgi:hypothetical protein
MELIFSFFYFTQYFQDVIAGWLGLMANSHIRAPAQINYTANYKAHKPNEARLFLNPQ